MPAILAFFVLVISLLALAKSAEVVVRNLVRIGHILSWSTFVVAFLILGIVTSTPEFLVGINSAFDRTPELSLGNLIGATIVLLTLISSTVAIVSGRLTLNPWLSFKQLLIMDAVILLPIFLLYDAALTKIDGLLMMLAYIFYALWMFSQRERFTHQISHNNAQEIKLAKAGIVFVLAFLGVVISSRFAVTSAVTIADFLNVPIFLIGILVFSLGTNLPELILTITALSKNQKTVIVGDLLGSATTNTLVLSLVALIQPFKISDLEVFSVSVFFLVLSVVVFTLLIRTKNEISKDEGFVLLGIYLVFLVTQVLSRLV